MHDGGLHEVEPRGSRPDDRSHAATRSRRDLRDGGGDVRAERRTRRRFTIGAIVVAAGLLVAAAVLGVLTGPFASGADADATPAAVAPPVDAAGTSGTVLAQQTQAGQCFAAFESAWQGEFELADCAAPHAAQLVSIVPADALLGSEAFPGEEVLRAEAMRACQSPSAMDVGLASTMPGLVVAARYPVTEGEWAAGDRSYRCFASLESGEPFTEDLRPVA